MGYRCIIQPVIIGVIADIGLSPLMGGTVANRIVFAKYVCVLLFPLL